MKLYVREVWTTVMQLCLLTVLGGGMTLTSYADTNPQEAYGTNFTGWPADNKWNALGGLEDPNEGDKNRTGDGDLVGDTTYPCGYWATNAAYVFFRMRVQNGTNPTFNSDAYYVMVCVSNSASAFNHKPDAVFVWDSNNRTGPENHGLENSTNIDATLAANWSDVTFEDRDGSSGSKTAPPDFQYSSSTTTPATNGYIRYTTNVAAGTFGKTSFIDIAVAWKFLKTANGTSYTPNTSLNTNQHWKIALAVKYNANDHGKLGNSTGFDVAGGATTVGAPTATTGGWSSTIMFPTKVVLYDMQSIVKNNKVTVTWKTASEVNTLGFRLYRQIGTDQWLQIGGFVPSLGMNNGGIGADYELEDSTAMAGQQYTYKLVEEETTGNLETYGPYLLPYSELRMKSPVLLTGNEIELHWLSRPNEVYRILSSTNLVNGFTPIADDIPATPPQNVYKGTSPRSPSFYKIEVK